jgi:hypothetical protein
MAFFLFFSFSVPLYIKELLLTRFLESRVISLPLVTSCIRSGTAVRELDAQRGSFRILSLRAALAFGIESRRLDAEL